MAKFTDARQRTWVVALDVQTAKRVKTTLGVDLLDVGNGELYARLASDPETIVDVLHCLLQDDCQRLQIDAVEFARGLCGDVLDAASAALLEALCDFFPSRRRALLKTAATKTQILLDRQITHATSLLQGDRMDQALEARLQTMDRELDAQIAALASGKPSTSGPASSASPPAF